MFSSADIWLEYLLRFAHVIAGIVWIGESFYFIWLDAAFTPPKESRANVDGEVFMVHGGFYYQVEKKRISPGELPEKLHWFKWEATLTWITGFLLLIVVYFLRGASLLIDPQVFALTQFQAIALTLALTAGSWLIYDAIWNVRIVPSKKLSLVLSVLALSGLVFLCNGIFSGRGMFILMGAILGTLMFLNVWVRILPGQAKIVAAAEAGEVPDYSIGLKSKVRSVHNTYFIFPVLFMMLSNHYPAIYNHHYNWLLLVILALSGALLRHAMVARNPVERWTLVPAAVGLLSMIFVTAHQPAAAVHSDAPREVHYADLRPVVERRCLSCHSSANSDDIFTSAPNGVLFETEAQLWAKRDQIMQHVVVGRTMPLMNKTEMTDEERYLFKVWLESSTAASNF